MNLQKSLKNRTVEVGHFQEGKRHYSGMTHPELLRRWANGQVQFGVYKDALTQFQANKSVFDDSALDKAFKEFIKGGATIAGANKLMDEIGTMGVEAYKKVFGVVSVFMQTDADGTPLKEKGDLEKATRYRKR